MQQKNYKIFIFPIVSLAIFTLLIFGAGYAYFNGSTTMATSNYQVNLPLTTSLICSKSDCNVTVTPAMMTNTNTNATTAKATSTCYVNCTCSGTQGAVCNYNVSLIEAGRPYIRSTSLGTNKEFTVKVTSPSGCTAQNTSGTASQVDLKRDKIVSSCSLTVPAGGSISANVSAQFKWYNLDLDQTISANQIYNYKLSTDSLLPDEYQPVEYISPSGNVYINTNVTYATDVIIYDRVSYIELSSSASYLISGITSTVYWGLAKKSNVWYWTCGGSNTSTTPTLGTIYDLRVDLGAKQLYVDGVLTDTRTSSVSGSGNLYLFAAKNASNTTPGYYEANIKRYRTKIYKNGTLTRDFVPCYIKSTSEVGMYDLVSGSFFNKNGDGSLTAGPDISL